MLVSCPVCRKQISDRAPMCPFCGGTAKAPGPSPVTPSAMAPVLPAQKPATPQRPVAPVQPALVPDALPAYQRGDFIGDLFQVVEKLGEGGFGIVYLARSLASNDIIALKTLRGELLRDAKTRALFEKEARIWMDLGTHPNLVRAKWVDEVGGRLYIAMEYVQAGAGRPNSLEGHLERGTLPLERMVLWAIQFCQGMEYAVSKGIRCHRDIKPANILIGGDGVVKISDFGIAGLALVPDAPKAAASAASTETDAADPAKTVVGTVFGTPTHMSPEQFVDAASCDERSDIYSFGIVLYQMASNGRLPFRPPPPPPELRAQAGAYFWHAFRTLHSTAPEPPLQSPLSAIIARALRKKKDDRYQTFKSLRADLEMLYTGLQGREAPAPSARKETAGDWNAKGMSFATLKRWAEALECYDKAIALEAGIAALHNNRGNALRQLGRPEESLACYERAIALDPLYAAAFENKAILYAHAQRNEDALVCIERAIALDPTKADPRVVKGVLLARLGREREALAAYDEALAIDPRHVDAWFNKANSLGRTNRVLAIQCIDHALAADPAYVAGWDLKGTLLSELGRGADAIACHLEGVKLRPMDGRLRYNLGNSWASIERLEEARACYQAATQLEPGMAIAWYNLAITVFRMGDLSGSVPLFDRFLSFDPEPNNLRRTAERLIAEIRAGRTPTLGPIVVGSRITPEEQASIDAQLLPAVGQASMPVPPGAAQAVLPPREQEPLPPPRPDAETVAMEAARQFNGGRFDEALATVDAFLRIDPHDAKTLNTRASALFKLQRLEEAHAAIDRAIEASPNALAFWLNKLVMEHEDGRFQRAYRSAIDLLEIAQVDGASGQAVDEARRAITRLQGKGVVPGPRSHLAFLGLGFASMVKGRTDPALDFLDQAIAAAPENSEAARWKGHALKQLGRADDALAAYDRAAALSPMDPEVHHDRGVALAMLREFDRAVTAFDQALALDPNHTASLSDKGKYAGELGRHEEALSALRRAAALMPAHPAPWLNKALVEDLLGREDDALVSHQNFLEWARPEMRLQIEASKRRVEQLRARATARRGPPPEASPPGREAAAKPTPVDDPFLKSIASFFSEDGDDLSNEEMARLAKAMDGDDAATLLEMLRKVEGEASPPPGRQARAALSAPPEASTARPTGNPVAKKWAEQARENLRAQKPIEALAAIDKATERDPEEATYWVERGRVLRTLSRGDESRASFEKALALDPRSANALIGLADGERSCGRAKEAIVLLNRATSLDPANANGWYALGEAYRDAADWPNAYRVFAACAKLAPRNALAIVGLAEGALNVGRVDDALLALEVAIELDGSLANAWFLRGAAHAHKGRFAEAAEAQRRAVELDPERVGAWYNLAHNLHALKRHAEAVDAADRALALRPDFAYALNTKGLALHALKRTDEALAAYDAALAADSRSVQALCNKGVALLSLGRAQEAFACFTDARTIKPDHGPALEGCRSALEALKQGLSPKEEPGASAAGLVLPEVSVPQTAAQFSQDECLKRAEMARNHSHFDRALDFADQAIVADPRKHSGWFAKAEALFALRRYAEAAAHAKKAIELNPKYGPSWVRLASSFDALGANDEALAAWDKAVEVAGQNVLNWSGRGQCLARMGRVEEALACHEKALAIDPRFSIGKFHKGQLEATLGRREDAIKSLQQFLALAPPNLVLMVNEARKRIQELKA